MSKATTIYFTDDPFSDRKSRYFKKLVAFELFLVINEKEK